MTKAKTRKKTSKASWRAKNARKNMHLSFRFGASLVVLFAIGAGIFANSWFDSKKDVNAANCTISDKLVNSCRPWLSAAVGGYTMVSGNEQFAFFNKRLNNPNVLTNPNAATTLTYKMDIPHVYHPPGTALFNGDAQRALNDTSLYGSPTNPVLVNWKPGDKWADVAAGKIDSTLINAAKTVKGLGSRKIFLTLWHEPENDNVNAVGLNITGQCKTPNGPNGSAADYRAMWRHVKEVFQQQGANNVVWFWNLTGFVGDSGTAGWACIVKDLYPGNDVVDWIMWDPYASSSDGDFVKSVSRFYNFLTQNSDAQHDFKSKPWGLAEHGSNTDPAVAAGYWNKAKDAIGTSWSNNKFPNIKLYSVFDTASNGGINGGLRVGYNISGNIDVNEQAAFNEYAKAVLNFSSSPSTPPPPPAGDTVPPTVALTQPADGSEVKGTITITGQASDNVKVTAVTLRINDKWVATDDAAPYSFSVDTNKYTDGQYSLVLRAWDPSGNAGQSQTVTVRINNKPGTDPKEELPPPPPGGIVITPISPSTPTKPIPARGTIIVSPSAAGNSVQVFVDGEQLPNNVIDTGSLTNGTHEVKIIENGQETKQYISVKNPLPIAIVNHIRDKAVPYSVGFVTAVALAVLWVGRGYITGLTSRKERRLQKSQRDYRGK